MPRDWLDSTYDEVDNLPRYNFLNREGNIVVSDVKAEISSPIVVDGDRIGAAVLNLVSERGDDGTPLLAIDGGTVANPTGYQTIYGQGGGALPTQLLPRQLFAADNGDLYLGDSSGTPVLLGNQEQISQVQNNLNAHITNYNNPHNVTIGQIGAAAATTVDAHINNFNNPHQVTAAQAGAAPLVHTHNFLIDRGDGVSHIGFIRRTQTVTINADSSGYGYADLPLTGENGFTPDVTSVFFSFGNVSQNDIRGTTATPFYDNTAQRWRVFFYRTGIPLPATQLIQASFLVARTTTY